MSLSGSVCVCACACMRVWLFITHKWTPEKHGLILRSSEHPQIFPVSMGTAGVDHLWKNMAKSIILKYLRGKTWDNFG